VKRLRVELTGECFYLRLIDDVRSADEALAQMQIIEIEPLSDVCVSASAMPHLQERDASLQARTV
jgi:hypothetical protein